MAAAYGAFPSVPMELEVVRAGPDRVAELADVHLGFHTYLEADAPDGGPYVWFMRADPPMSG